MPTLAIRVVMPRSGAAPNDAARVVAEPTGDEGGAARPCASRRSRSGLRYLPASLLALAIAALTPFFTLSARTSALALGLSCLMSAAVVHQMCQISTASCRLSERLIIRRPPAWVSCSIRSSRRSACRTMSFLDTPLSVASFSTSRSSPVGSRNCHLAKDRPCDIATKMISY